ncbi:hypothetical protein [Streptomyces sp. NBC_00342]|uniref:hypothetical protein n=1 Tax=Streptomyces sp. NBC_00342 TaxID=2975718 RepID=UPI002E2A8DEF|nr:hypothetical protein [Streptomyces sp. NBC_00342]
MNSASSTDRNRIAGPDGMRLVAAGKDWDAVRVSRFLGLQVLERLGSAAGPVLVDPVARTMYFLVPAGSTRAWDVPQTQPLGETAHVVVPPQARQSPPGPFWLVSSQRPLASASVLRQALLDVQGPRPTLPLVLESLTFDQIKGWNCALCNARLLADRSLGVFSTGHGVLADPTELWACAPACGAVARKGT